MGSDALVIALVLALLAAAGSGIYLARALGRFLKDFSRRLDVLEHHLGQHGNALDRHGRR